MADQLQIRGGTTAQTNVFTGAQREVTVDTDKNTLVVHNGVTAGGFPMASESKLSNGTFYFNDNVSGGSAANSYLLDAKLNTNRPSNYADGIQLGFVTANANAAGPSTANFSGLGVKSIKYPGGIDPAAGDIFGRVYLIYDAGNDWLELQRKSVAPPPQLRAVTATVSSNDMTVTMPPSIISFRSPTLGNGLVNDRTVTSSIALFIPAGATLGTVSGVPSRIVLLAVDNAGVVRLAVVNQNTTQVLDEAGLINTTAISAGSSSANTIYASTSMSGVPYRVLGFVDSTQPTAGFWSTSPSLVQPIGGQTILSVPKIVTSAVQNTTSGTSIDFTGIPPWAKLISVAIQGMSTNGTSNVILRLGTSAGAAAAGYLGSHFGSATVNVINQTIPTGFIMETAMQTSFVIHSVFHLVNLGGNVWVATGTMGENTTARSSFVTGSIGLPGVLDRVRLTTAGGTDSFDAGSMSITYQG